jgi:hypothetical protein
MGSAKLVKTMAPDNHDPMHQEPSRAALLPAGHLFNKNGEDWVLVNNDSAFLDFYAIKLIKDIENSSKNKNKEG